MDINALVIIIVIGAIAGWLAGMLMKGGYSLIGNIVIGIIGAFIGGFVFSFFNITTSGIIGSIVTATVGAILLILLLRVIKK
ncbi:GlsB/YeaQ/YmgE family stress response membrane protein [Shewanella gaetbuli]|uniref:GlsB/YeaQ/YmgE family stress response membrane protein n=1 Tax=Shewanella gaetbuli TaxID=220752 RepID=A0A9X1ZH56_9GAMM|nr:GlsB/YeaQ/YmgE family stress response membrane protein [Shewanella gaetbuli]MCL1142229.1 GlsB/YeaQ/YmgE family stress response membrane protein [Shewanella gaetbuli]